MKQHVERELTNALGDVVKVRLTIDTDAAPEREIIVLANKASNSTSRKATAAGGVLLLEIVK